MTVNISRHNRFLVSISKFTQNLILNIDGQSITTSSFFIVSIEIRIYASFQN
jgi:hypothetical protein